MALDPKFLLPGDVLIYSPTDVVGDIIAALTHGLESHVEVAVTQSLSFAARPIGTNYYDIRIDKSLMCVRRGEGVFDLDAAKQSVTSDVGKPYCFGGLFSFFDPWKRSRHVHRVCSVMANKFLVGGGIHAFNQAADPNLFSPADFWITGGLWTVWTRGQVAPIK